MAALIVHGARGSYPVSGEAVVRYGGNTSCFSIETSSGLLVVDAGTGLASLATDLARRTRLPPITLLFTHFHLDHVIGLTAFKPLLRADADITILADPSQAGDWRQTLKTLMGAPFWPVPLLEAGATIRFEDLPRRRGTSEIVGPVTVAGIPVSWCPVWHPQGCVSYRFTLDGRDVLLATDREHGHDRLDGIFRAFCQRADILIHDAQYTPEEHVGRVGWGHSTWRTAATLAADLGAQQLILASHDPSKSDLDVDRLVESARHVFPHTSGARENMVVDIARAAERPTPQPILVQAVDREEEPALTFRYRFRLAGGAEKLFAIALDPKTLQLRQPARDTYPEWTSLPHCKCSRCPLDDAEHPRCPAATSLIELVEYFGNAISTETVEVSIQTDARTYLKRAPLPEAIGSLMGLLMATSGCPILGKLKPMVRFHLPFASLEETQYRVLSMYLLAQFFVAEHGRTPDWNLTELPNLYNEIHQVNREFFQRLSQMQIQDASLNAIVRLDAFAESIAFSIDHAAFAELEEVFSAYLTEDRPGEDQPTS